MFINFSVMWSIKMEEVIGEGVASQEHLLTRGDPRACLDVDGKEREGF